MTRGEKKMSEPKRMTLNYRLPACTKIERHAARTLRAKRCWMRRAKCLPSAAISPRKMADPVAIIRELAAGIRRMREQYADIIRVMLYTAPHDEAVACALKTATSIYRKAFIPIAESFCSLVRCGRVSTSPAPSICSGFTSDTRRISRCTTTMAGLTSERSAGSKNLADYRQSVRHQIVTHVLGTFCHPCLRAGQRKVGCGGRI